LDKELHILILEDLPSDAELAEREVKTILNNFTVHVVDTEDEFIHALKIFKPDLIISDYQLPNFDGLSALKITQDIKPFTPFVVLTGSQNEDTAVECLKAGADDYVIKEHSKRLGPAVLNALEKKKNELERKQAEDALRIERDNLKNIFEAMEDGIYIVNQQYDIQYVNPVLENDFGPYEGHKCYAYFHDRDDACPWCKNPDVYAGKTVRWEWYSFKNQKTYDLIDTPLKNVDGSTSKLEIFRDITERVEAEEKIRRLLQQQTAANQLSLALGESRNLDLIYQTIFIHVRELMDSDTFIISSYDPDTKLIHANYVINEGNPWDATKLPAIPLAESGMGTQSQVILTGEPFYSADYREAVKKSNAEHSVNDAGIVTKGPPPINENMTNSVIYVPMKDEGSVIGVMQLQSYRKGAYSQDDINLLSGLANVAALAIQNARLFGEAQRHLDQLTALHKIDQAITGSLDLNIILDILLGQLLERLEVDAAVVLRYQAEIQTLGFVHGRGFRTPALQHTDLRLGHGYAGEVALQRRPIFIPDLNQAEDSLLESPLFSKEGFSTYYGVPLIAKGMLVGVLEIFHRSALDPKNEWVDFLTTLANQAALAIDNVTLFNDLQRSNVDLILAYDATIEGWARALELRDMETEGHSRRVVDLTLLLARKLGIRDKELVNVRRGALLHDIGKMGIPDKILQKPGALTEQEWRVMRQHPVYAMEWLSSIQYLRPALDIPYSHHEKWDGTGYPHVLRGEQIPLAARIFAIIDVWDALKSDRPYRKAWPEEKIIAHIQEQSEKHFDPQVVDAFLEQICSK